MVSASLALIVFTWYTPTASSATCPTPRMTDLTSKMNKVLCDTSTESIFNNISDNNNINNIFYAADNIIVSNEFFDDAHTVYNKTMHFAASTIQGYANTPQGYVTVNTFVSNRGHRIAVKISSALERLQSYVYSLQHTLSSVSGSVRGGCTALRYNTERYSMSRAVLSCLSKAGAMMSLLTTSASSTMSILLKGVARVVNLGLSTRGVAPSHLLYPHYSPILTTSFLSLYFTATYWLDIPDTLNIASTVLPASTLSSYTCCSPLLAPITTEPGWSYRHSRARNTQTYEYDRSCTQGQASVPGTLDRTCTASAEVSSSQLSLARQVSFESPAPLDSHTRAPGYMPSLRVVEWWYLCLAPLGSYKAFGHEDHLAHGSPE
eukprot:4866248-Prymnesium_polylepis.1